MPGPLPALLLHAALASEPDPVLAPPTTLAAEDGPAAVWVNPANMAYDPDPRWGVFFRHDPIGDAPWAAAASVGVAGVNLGVRWMRRDDLRNDVTIDLGAGVRLPQRLALGLGFHWALEGDAPNHVAFDGALSWRPLPWVGVSVIARQIGGPGGPNAAPAMSGGGFALRPFGRALLVGADFLHVFGDEARSVVAVSARVRPAEGLYLRARFDSEANLSAGIELYFGGVGGGVAGGVDPAGSPDVHAWIGSDEPGEALVRRARRVPVIALDDTPPYAPERRLLARVEPSWLDVLQQLETASAEPGVRGAIVSLGGVDFGPARWDELRDRIADLRAHDRPVLVYLQGEVPAGAVIAAAAADRVLVHPASVLQLTPPATEVAYLGGLLDAAGIDVQVVRHGDYKTASEALTRASPSAAEIEQQTHLLRQRFDRMVDDLSLGRGRTRDDARRWIEGGPWPAEDAVRMGIVDGLLWPDQLEAAVQALAPLIDPDDPPRLRPVDTAQRPRGRSPWEPPAEIGVIYVQGVLVDGETPRSPGREPAATGAATLVRQIERAARSSTVRAVVLRVESPGGSTFAADSVWRALERFQSTGKPLVVSLGDVAASGGYYIAAGADAIWAEPDTTTGSIGVIAVHPSIGGLLDRLGVQVATFRAGVHAPASALRRWDPSEEARMQAVVDAAYRLFQQRVSDGRGLTLDEVDERAGGRLWTGADAQTLGLVDHVGGLVEAIRDARRRAGVPDRRPVDVVTIQPDARLLDVLLPDLARLRLSSPAARAAALPVPAELTGWATWLHHAANTEDPRWMIEPALLRRP